MQKSFDLTRLQGHDRLGEVPHERGLLAADVLRGRRHRGDRQLSGLCTDSRQRPGAPRGGRRPLPVCGVRICPRLSQDWPLPIESCGTAPEAQPIRRAPPGRDTAVRSHPREPTLPAGVAFGAVIAAALASPAATATRPAPVSRQRVEPRCGRAVPSRADRACSGADGRPGPKVKAVVADADGSRHVRYDRTFRGLRVIGGDFVVAKDAAGATRHVYWNGSGKVAVASTSPKVPAPGGTRRPRRLRRAGHPPAGLGRLTDGRQGGPDPEPPAHHHRRRSPARPGLLRRDRDRHRQLDVLGHGHHSAPLRPARAGCSRTRWATTRPTSTARRPAPARCSPTPTTSGATAPAPTGRPPASTPHYGAATDLRLLQERARPQRHLRTTAPAPARRVHYGNAYVNAFWDGSF